MVASGSLVSLNGLALACLLLLSATCTPWLHHPVTAYSMVASNEVGESLLFPGRPDVYERVPAKGYRNKFYWNGTHANGPEEHGWYPGGGSGGGKPSHRPSASRRPSPSPHYSSSGSRSHSHSPSSGASVLARAAVHHNKRQAVPFHHKRQPAALAPAHDAIHKDLAKRLVSVKTNNDGTELYTGLDCLDSTFTEDDINFLFQDGGANVTVQLCPGTVIYMQNPVEFSNIGQELSTLGYPTDGTRAKLIVNGTK